MSWRAGELSVGTSEPSTSVSTSGVSGSVSAGDLQAFDRLPSQVDTLVVFCFRDQRPLHGPAGFLDWRLCGELSGALLDGLFEGHPQEVILLPTRGRLGRRRIFAFGLGNVGIACRESFEAACRHALGVLERAGARVFGVLAPTSADRPELEKIFTDVATRVFGDRAQCMLVSPCEVVYSAS